MNFVAPLDVGGTLLPCTKVTSVLLPAGLYCPDTGTVPPVLTVVFDFGIVLNLRLILSFFYMLQVNPLSRRINELRQCDKASWCGSQ